jgi:hypothetical protein
MRSTTAASRNPRSAPPGKLSAAERSSLNQALAISLFGVLRRYGGWNGAQEEIDSRLHEALSPVVPERENRELLFKSLTVQGNPAKTSLANLRTAKQVADLYLIQVANRTWRRILDRREGEGEVESP